MASQHQSFTNASDCLAEMQRIAPGPFRKNSRVVEHYSIMFDRCLDAEKDTGSFPTQADFDELRKLYAEYVSEQSLNKNVSNDSQ